MRASWQPAQLRFHLRRSRVIQRVNCQPEGACSAVSFTADYRMAEAQLGSLSKYVCAQEWGLHAEWAVKTQHAAACRGQSGGESYKGGRGHMIYRNGKLEDTE